MTPLVDTLAIVGVGLIGGSIGAAARARGVAQRVVGVGRDPASLQPAVQAGLVDAILPSLPAAAEQADLMVFCTPVDRIVAQVREAASVARPRTLLTDAGSTKASLVAELDQLPNDLVFIGGHPLAGSEKRGFAFACHDLFDGKRVVLTPTARTPPASLDHLVRFWSRLGARVRCMDAHEHDRALALTSHLPHLAASALAGLLPDAWRDLAASGFRDTTRVAAGDPRLWSAIFQDNRRELLTALDQLRQRLEEYRQALTSEDADTLERLWMEGKRNRDALGS